MPLDAEAVRNRLRALGFDEVRFARVGPTLGAAALQRWLEQGYDADMAWMARSAAKRADPDQVLPGARTLIMLGVNYWRDRQAEPGRPVWARYGLHEDYHDTIKVALTAAGKELETMAGVTASDYRYYVDTGPVLERSWAAEAGIGFVGKNAMLISRRYGNWLFLAAILPRVELPADEPIRRQRPVAGEAGEQDAIGLLCGKCTRCIDACPTNAIRAPGVVDANRCISYQTLENKGIIPIELRRGIGARVFGCDVCLEVCPWNRFAEESRSTLLVARTELADLTLKDILQLTPERFAAVFRKTAVKRLKISGLLRNACVAAANLGAVDCLDDLERLVRHDSPVVRAHAVWAVRQLGGEERLATLRQTETHPDVIAEYEASR